MLKNYHYSYQKRVGHLSEALYKVPPIVSIISKNTVKTLHSPYRTGNGSFQRLSVQG